MSRIRMALKRAVLALFTIGSTAFATASPAAERRDRVTVIANVSVVPMDRESVIANQSVVVKGGRISQIGPSKQMRVAAGAAVIDGSGKYLMPALVDCHTHPRSDTELAAFRGFGIAKVLALGGELQGWRPEVRRRLRDAPLPAILSSSRPIDGNPPLSRRFYSLDEVGHVASAVASERSAGASLIKTYSSLQVPVLKEIARQAHLRGMPVIGHTPWNSSAEEVLKGGLDIVAHGEELFQYLGDNPSNEKIDYVVALMRANGVALVPNIVGYTSMAQHAYELGQALKNPQVELVSPTTWQEWLPRNNTYANRKDLDRFRSTLTNGLATLKRLALVANRAEVLLLAGTDAPSFCFPGECLLSELELLSNSGLSNYEVLRTATANPAKVLSRFKAVPARFGTIEVGNDADLVLLASNPLEDLAALTRIQGVLIGGRWISASQMDAERAATRAEAIRAHDVVDRYESLLSQDRIDDLAAFLHAQPQRRFPRLSIGIVLRDANSLATKGRVKDAMRLLAAAEPHVAITPGLHNLLGDLKIKDGQLDGAGREYSKALKMMPGNGQFLAGLRDLERGQRHAR